MKAMKALLKSGNTEKIIFFAGRFTEAQKSKLTFLRCGWTQAKRDFHHGCQLSPDMRMAQKPRYHQGHHQFLHQSSRPSLSECF